MCEEEKVEPIFKGKNEMSITDLEVAIKKFVFETSEKTPITFNVLINALMNVYVNTFLQFVADKKSIISNMSEHIAQVCGEVQKLIEAEEALAKEANDIEPEIEPDIIVEPKE